MRITSPTTCPGGPLLEALEPRVLLDGALFQSTPSLTISSPTLDADSRFGESVAALGGNILVGAPYEDDIDTESGAAYLFDGTTGALLRTLHDPNVYPDATLDWFGTCVAAWGSNALVSAVAEDCGAPDSGVVYLFDGQTGGVLRTFFNPIPSTHDGFGTSLGVLNGNLVCGVPFADAAGADAGAVYVLDGSTGARLQTLLSPLPEADNYFGWVVAVWGGNILAGEVWGPNGGAVYMFDGTTGALVRTFSNPSPNPGDRFGSPVAVEGNRVIVGAPFDDTSASNAGAVYVFDGTTGGLLRTLSNPSPAAGDSFGNGSLVAVGGYVVASAIWDDSAGADAGQVYVFDAATGALVQTLQNPSPASTRDFGRRLVLMGTDLLVTARERSGSNYLVYVFRGLTTDGTAPTANLAQPTNGSTIPLATINTAERYIDVVFDDQGGSGLNTSTITDPEAEFDLSGTAAGGVTVNGAPTLVSGTTSTYRYAFTGSFAAGPVSVDFLADTWRDVAGNPNAAETELFTVTEGQATVTLSLEIRFQNELADLLWDEAGIDAEDAVAGVLDLTEQRYSDGRILADYSVSLAGDIIYFSGIPSDWDVFSSPGPAGAVARVWMYCDDSLNGTIGSYEYVHGNRTVRIGLPGDFLEGDEIDEDFIADVLAHELAHLQGALDLYKLEVDAPDETIESGLGVDPAVVGLAYDYPGGLWLMEGGDPSPEFAGGSPEQDGQWHPFTIGVLNRNAEFLSSATYEEFDDRDKDYTLLHAAEWCPGEVRLRVVDASGTPLAGRAVAVYQKVCGDLDSNPGPRMDGVPDFLGLTDGTGTYVFPAPTALFASENFVILVAVEGAVPFFMDITEWNLAYWDGHTTTYETERTVLVPGDVTWQGGADDHWENAGNWSGVVALGPATTAVFGGSTTYQPSLYQDQSVKGVDFQTGDWTISGSGHTLGVGADGIDSAGAGINTVDPNVALAADSTWTVGTYNTLNLNGDLAGEGHTLTKDGEGTVVLGGSENRLSALVVGAGTVRLAPGRGVLVLDSLVIGTAPDPGSGFEAYNDFGGTGSGYLGGNVTAFTLTSGGPLIDYETGLETGATLTLSGGGGTWTLEEGGLTAGTDAYSVFHGIVDANGHTGGMSAYTLTFTGLDPQALYEVVLFGDRAYPGAPTSETCNVYTISDADAFENASTTGISGATATMNVGNNTATGYVGRYRQVNPGSDGDFVVTVSASGGDACWRLNAMQLRQDGAGAASPPVAPTAGNDAVMIDAAPKVERLGVVSPDVSQADRVPAVSSGMAGAVPLGRERESAGAVVEVAAGLPLGAPDGHGAATAVEADVPSVLAAPATALRVAAAAVVLPETEAATLGRIERETDAGAWSEADLFIWEEGPRPDRAGALPHGLDDDLVGVLELVDLVAPLGV